LRPLSGNPFIGFAFRHFNDSRFFPHNMVFHSVSDLFLGYFILKVFCCSARSFVVFFGDICCGATIFPRSISLLCAELELQIFYYSAGDPFSRFFSCRDSSFYVYVCFFINLQIEIYVSFAYFSHVRERLAWPTEGPSQKL